MGGSEAREKRVNRTGLPRITGVSLDLMPALLTRVSILGALLWALAGFCAPNVASAQLPNKPIRKVPTEAPMIDLYTMGIGDHFTEKFGHAAICVRFPTDPNADLCYNYGTTDFQDPVGMGWGFVRGRSKFWVSAQAPPTMLGLYVHRDRDVWVQELQLPETQARAIAAQLAFDLLEENRYYHYHHFNNNCATRIRDLIDKTTNGKLSANAGATIAPSYRDFGREGFASMPMLALATDYVLGRVGDKHPTEYEAMFLPQILREAVRVRFGANPIVVYERKGPDFRTDPGHGRLYVFLLSLLLAMPLFWAWYHRKIGRLHLIPGVLTLFLVAILLWTLAVLSPLPMARLNENLLLFFPADLALLFLSARLRQRYAQVRVSLVLLASLFAVIGILNQPLWVVAALPAMILLPLALPRADDPRQNIDADSPENTQLED